jgi:hypothetical protein
MDDTDSQGILYEHTQRAWWTVLALLAGLAFQTAAAVRDVRSGRKRAWSHLPGMLLFAFGTFLTSSLSVVVRPGELEVAYTAGLFRRRLDLTGVEAAAVAAVPWYYGRGIRFTPRGWLYSVWGREGVSLTYADGHTVTVGSDEPYLLLSAVEQARRGGA